MTEIHDDVAQGLEIVTTRLFNAEMSVDTCIHHIPKKSLVLTIRNVKVGLQVTVFLSETKAN